MTNESSANAIIGNTLRIIASGEYHPGAELTQKMASYIIELEQKLTDMAVQLANAESKCRELAAENAALKEVVSGVNSELYGQGFEVSGWHLNGALEPLDNWFTDNGWGMPETPATDAFLAEVRASCVESAINTVIAMMNHQHPVTSKAIDILRVHAAQLRKGAAL